MANSIRKVSEDVKLRPFLSSHFDSQTYIKTVIKEGRSEECFNNVASCIEEVNEEIKGYISQHKDVLMSGMQDVALLSERYSLLYSTSQKLQRNVDRLKKEALQSYDLVKLRTMELERIHSTSMILRQLRQFVHCRAQLEHLLKAASELGGIKAGSGINSDIRHLASSAKTLFELEGVLAVPALLEIKFVAQHVKSIREFGRQLRELAMEQLLTALAERNQAYVAASLQVFFNLQSLPEIVLLAVDATIKATVELSRGTLDLDSLVSSHPDLAVVPPVTGSGLGLGAGMGMPSRGSVSAALASAGSMGLQRQVPPPAPIAQQQSNSPALRTAMKEIAREWGTLISDQAMQIHVLQRVIAKKEDPSTHLKFTDTLEGVGQSNPALASNRLLDLFWARLQVCLLDTAAEKLKANPVACSRIYPFLRKAAVDAVENLKILSSRDLSRDAITGYGGTSGMYGGGTDGRNTVTEYPAGQGSWTGLGMGMSGGVGGERVMGEGMFGSSAWTSSGGGLRQGTRRRGGNELLCCLGMGNRRVTRSDATNRRQLYHDDGSPRGVKDHRTRYAPLDAEDDEGEGQDRIAQSELLQIAEAEAGLVGGLKPFRDRYLAGALSRMTGPVLQMFPEMDGYSAAVPSRRDMLALIKAIQSELGSAAVEGDAQGGLLRAVCKEAVKAVQLMVSKVEGMISFAPDVHKILIALPGAPIPVGTVTRTAPQEHNAQLLGLLVQLRDALGKTPLQVSSRGGEGGEPSEGVEEQTLGVLTRSLKGAIVCLDTVISKQILAPLITAISSHVKTVLLPLLKEGVSTVPASVRTLVHEDQQGMDCSRPVQTIVKLLPEVVKVHLLSLATCPPVTGAVEELGLRILHLYVTVAALIRPVSEQARLRTARDMGALEAALSSAGISLGGETNPVMLEFRAFRRLLFMDDASEPSSLSNAVNSTAVGGTAGSGMARPPSRAKLQTLPFVRDLRPSVLLAYLTSCGPSQLPSPYFSATGANAESDPGYLQQSYVDFLTELKSDIGPPQRRALVPSVSSLYINKLRESGRGEKEWGDILGETRSWECVQGSLDVYVQRISVADAQQKAHMRAWYESLQDIGGLYYASTFSMQ